MLHQAVSLPVARMKGVSNTPTDTASGTKIKKKSSLPVGRDAGSNSILPTDAHTVLLTYAFMDIINGLL